MARVCYVCGKGSQPGNTVSHANNRVKRSFRPNLRRVRIYTDEGKKKRVRVCTRCIKADKIRKAV